MVIQLQSTTSIQQMNGAPTRLWRGTTDTGIEVNAFIAFVMVANEADRPQVLEALDDSNCIDRPHDLTINLNQLLI